jgi:hypothetical protein
MQSRLETQWKTKTPYLSIRMTMFEIERAMVEECVHVGRQFFYSTFCIRIKINLRQGLFRYDTQWSSLDKSRASWEK